MGRISVVIPAFNAEDFISATIESALAQAGVDVEVIVVDDGSSDATQEKVLAFGSAVRLIPQQRRGPAKARNTGVAAGSSEWVAFLDADDIWLPAKSGLQLETASRTNSPFVFTDRYNIGARGPLPDRQSDVQPLSEGDIFEPLLHDNFITTSSVLIRRDLFLETGGFSEDPTLPPAEDWDLWLRVAAAHRAAAHHEPLVRYRHHESGASRNVYRMNQARRRVIERAMDLPRGRALPEWRKREIWSETWVTNGWDAARHGHTGDAIGWYLRAVAQRPTRGDLYLNIARTLLGRIS